tara:strand:+ start:422 stop:541 length:120 start_codon:yes stop_codon:yes gene_type:complete
MNFIKKFWNNLIGKQETKVKVIPKKVKIKTTKITRDNIG